MEDSDYRGIARSIGARRRLGQNFLINRGIARSEANFGIGRDVLEMGPGLGVLTKELCKVAKSVTSVEKDKRLCGLLEKDMKSEKLTLINDDFFSVPRKRTTKLDIMISNIPYNLSSKTIAWLGDAQMPAVLCLQKEFVDHMKARHSTRDYSRLSVIAQLQFEIRYIMNVPANNFFPEPKVGSSLVYLKPRGVKIRKDTNQLISLLMMHKKKKFRNALIDSSRALGVDEKVLVSVTDSLPERDKRVFQADPEAILDAAKRISSVLSKS